MFTEGYKGLQMFRKGYKWLRGGGYKGLQGVKKVTGGYNKLQRATKG